MSLIKISDLSQGNESFMTELEATETIAVCGGGNAPVPVIPVGGGNGQILFSGGNGGKYGNNDNFFYTNGGFGGEQILFSGGGGGKGNKYGNNGNFFYTSGS